MVRFSMPIRQSYFFDLSSSQRTLVGEKGDGLAGCPPHTFRFVAHPEELVFWGNSSGGDSPES